MERNPVAPPGAGGVSGGNGPTRGEGPDGLTTNPELEHVRDVALKMVGLHLGRNGEHLQPVQAEHRRRGLDRHGRVDHTAAAHGERLGHRTGDRERARQGYGLGAGGEDEDEESGVHDGGKGRVVCVLD